MSSGNQGKVNFFFIFLVFSAIKRTLMRLFSFSFAFSHYHLFIVKVRVSFSVYDCAFYCGNGYCILRRRLLRLPAYVTASWWFWLEKHRVNVMFSFFVFRLRFCIFLRWRLCSFSGDLCFLRLRFCVSPLRDSFRHDCVCMCRFLCGNCVRYSYWSWRSDPIIWS
jgi:hypothetical protein